MHVITGCKQLSLLSPSYQIAKATQYSVISSDKHLPADSEHTSMALEHRFARSWGFAVCYQSLSSQGKLSISLLSLLPSFPLPPLCCTSCGGVDKPETVPYRLAAACWKTFPETADCKDKIVSSFAPEMKSPHWDLLPPSLILHLSSVRTTEAGRSHWDFVDATFLLCTASRPGVPPLPWPGLSLSRNPAWRKWSLWRKSLQGSSSRQGSGSC